MDKPLRIDIWVTGFTSALLLASCVTRPVRSVGPRQLHNTEGLRTEAIQPKATEAELKPADNAFSAAKYEEAIGLYRRILARYPAGATGAYCQFKIATASYYKGDFSQAAREYSIFVHRYPDSELTFDVLYSLAATRFEMKEFGRANETLSHFTPDDIQSEGSARAELVFDLMGKTAEALGDVRGAVSAYASELSVASSEEKRSFCEDKVKKHLREVRSQKDLEWLKDRVTEPTARAMIAERLSAFDFALAGGATVGSAAESIATTPGGERHNAGGAAERLSIGVLLPLSGKMAIYGNKALEGLLLAARQFQNQSFSFQLHIEDTESSPVLAQEKARKLLEEDKVIAIMGPLGYRESLAAGQVAESYGTALISLSARPGVQRMGRSVFQNTLSPDNQVNSLVRFCYDKKHFTRFAILAPETTFGNEFAVRFMQAVRALGASVVGYQTYPPGATDFQKEIRRLVGLSSDVRFRKQEAARLSEYLLSLPSKKSANVTLRPIVDFDALFIPDSPKIVAQIAPSLNYFDVTTPLLGTIEWNSRELTQRLGRFAQGALFAGVLNPNTRDALQRTFLENYRAAYQTEPDVLSALAFESLELVDATLRKTSSSQRSDFVETLSSIRDLHTVLGITTVDPDRTTRRALSLFRIGSQGRIEEED